MRNFSEENTGDGWFAYIKDPWNAYIEVMSFDKLIISDARRRNQIFFDKLALPKLDFQ